MKQHINSVVEQLQTFPDVFIDHNVGQGKVAFFDQLTKRIGEEQALRLVDGMMASYIKEFDEFHRWVRPYALPQDYFYFLQHYGGFLIRRKAYTLMVHGVGPMVEEWYEFLMDNSLYIEPSRDGFLKIADLSFKISQQGLFPRVVFFIDLAGHIQQGSVIGIGPRTKGDPSFLHILKYGDNDKRRKIIASSFTQWLVAIAATQGLLGY